ncbi:hypothetical protein L1987_35677 [Smallanthus sonchifolius]|uniref:Uncharacterized protein n=1 Tax=Smallanthus sonchifolius TaxID=185202 RepID=A0ACB9HBE1_9ASTR|nr:hypothetical protein L1987_35677 [Smallanthus sonchifolius]
MEKRPCSEFNATGGAAGDEHDGVSASADRVAKPPCKEPPIGGAASDEYHGVSDSTYDLATLADHINRFETEPRFLMNWVAV